MSVTTLTTPRTSPAAGTTSSTPDTIELRQPAADRVPAGSTAKSRLAGAGALTFVTVVVAQNLVRGGSAPQPGASAEEVLTYFVDHRGLTTVLVAGFALAIAGLATFVAGTWERLAGSGRRSWATAGLLGVGTIITLFTGVLGSEQAMAVIAAGHDPSPAAVEALWALHNSIFTTNFVFIGLALVGLARAGVAAGITPKVFDRLAPVGAALLAVGTVGGPYIANGEAMPLFGLSGMGFLVWLAFLTTTGLRLVRGRT